VISVVWRPHAQNSAPNQNRSGTLSGPGPGHRKALSNRDEAPHSCYAWVTLHEQQSW
jgi:hypothetical protein